MHAMHRTILMASGLLTYTGTDYLGDGLQDRGRPFAATALRPDGAVYVVSVCSKTIQTIEPPVSETRIWESRRLLPDRLSCAAPQHSNQRACTRSLQSPSA